jgi:hypothetical protein
LPINTAGTPVNDLAIAAFWDSGAQAYRLRSTSINQTSAPTTVPAPTAQKPLVGTEWAVLAQGDFNGDGRRDVLAYKPGSVAPKVIDPNQPLLVSELVIVQEGTTGQPELQLSITPTQVFVPGRALVRYAAPPSGFQVGIVAGRQGALQFTALDATGQPINQRILLAWDAGQGLYLQ